MHEYCDTVNRIKIQYVTINAEDDFKINILPVSCEYHEEKDLILINSIRHAREAGYKLGQ